ncbi:receptor-type tyrosine-protein phosphatase eta [Labrus mixtus]|uniref:receptor-type tyrosine-protein phosphatase eta n=1 Tax=Labrus mixtus TaxID=508554 RepID=UPI0029C0CD0D|nr:receptor-type tyrosine-protein phosphatase eta [Labrus mixtus]
MGKLLLKDKVIYFIVWALMWTYSSAEREYFYQSRTLTWEDARSYCQVCFKDLMTMTPENIQTFAGKLSSDSWIGLRKNFYSTTNTTTNATDNYTINATDNYTINATDNYTINATDNYTINATSNTSLPWSRWANGDPLSFQNWYPGWPKFKSPFPKRDCCSCSCTCPATTTTPRWTTPSVATTRAPTAAPFTDFTDQNVTSFSGQEDTENTTGITDQNVTDISGFGEFNTENATSFTLFESSENTSSSDTIHVSTQSPPLFNTTPPVATSMLPLEAECAKSPMLTPDVPDIEENFIEDSCVAMLSFGAWVEKHCFELLTFICYEDRFFGQANVTNVTTSSAILTWLPAPGDISHYRVEVKGQAKPVGILNNLNYDLLKLTAGTYYSVQVFAVKCHRDLSPQEVAFYTTPNKVENLNASNVTETSISLSWDKPDGNVDIYLINYQNKQDESKTEGIGVYGLIPGHLYTFTVFSGVSDRSTQSEESMITKYTKPGKVSDLKVSENTNTSLLLTWSPPEGKTSGYSVTVKHNDSSLVTKEVNETEMRETGLPMGTKITFSVRALTNGSLEGDEVTISDYTAPGQISNLMLTPLDHSISATWSPPEGNYSSFGVKLQLDGMFVENETSLKPCREFVNLKSTATYIVIVSAVSGHLSSLPVMRSVSTTPAAPKDLTVTKSYKNKITFQWKSPNNTASVMYNVKISSSFWKHSISKMIKDQTNYTFNDLNSGTRYEIEVQTCAGGKSSNPVTVSHFTEAETREISLSMMCSSAEALLCEKNYTRERVLEQLEAHFEKELGDGVFWELVKQET